MRRRELIAGLGGDMAAAPATKMCYTFLKCDPASGAQRLMKRRKFMALFAGAVTLCPLATSAQQPVPVVAVLSSGNTLPAFNKGLSDAGYRNGHDVRIEYHVASGHYNELLAIAQELVRRRVAVIVPIGINAANAAKVATSSIPIVFVFGVDPIKFGFVSSLSHPSGNITGMSLYTSELQSKRVELMADLVPPGAPIGWIVNPNMLDTEKQVPSVDAAARAKGHPLIVVRAETKEGIDQAFAAFAEHHVGGVLAVSDNFLYSRRDQMIKLAAQYSIPMEYPFRADAVAGGLLSYGTDLDEVYHSAGVYVSRVLRGEKPGQLPIQQPTKFGLVFNLKTAAKLRIKIPDKLLAVADELIE